MNLKYLSMLLISVISSILSCSAQVIEEKKPTGCWEKYYIVQNQEARIRLCFRMDDELEGWYMENMHGGDFHGQWKNIDNSSLRIFFEGEDETICNFSLVNSNKIRISRCNIFEGIWKQIKDPNLESD